MGMAIVPVGIACLVGPPICGAVLGANYEWWKGVLFASVRFLSIPAVRFVPQLNIDVDHGYRALRVLGRCVVPPS